MKKLQSLGVAEITLAPLGNRINSTNDGPKGEVSIRENKKLHKSGGVSFRHSL